MNTVPERAACSACGTSPVNHRLAFFFNTVDGFFTKNFARNLAAIQIPNENALTENMSRYVTQFFYALGLVRFSTDVEKAKSGRSELVWREAQRRGIPMQQIVFCGNPIEQYRALVHGHWRYFESLPIPPWLSQKGYAWADDKLALAHSLETAGLPAPKARLVTSWNEAMRAFAELSRPVIIKPRVGSRGRHTTTRIRTHAELKSAFALAKEIANELVVEEHVFGSVCRATVVNGVLVGFFRADPPQVTGDGKRTVSELTAEKNAMRNEKLGAIDISDDLVSCILRQGYNLESIPASGTLLDLSAKTGRFYGGATKEMLPEVHPKMHEVFAKAAKLVDAPVIGFDLIIEDPTADPDTQRWGIIECNSLPFIDLHYYALLGEPNDIAPHIWDLWQRN